MRKKFYGIKDVVNISGLDRNRIYYWSKTLKVIEPDYITPGRQFFDFCALLDFRLVFELQRIGLSPDHIKTIGSELADLDYDISPRSSPRRFTIWDIFLQNRSKYEQEGYFLASKENAMAHPVRLEDSGIEFKVGTADEIEKSMLRGIKRTSLRIRSILLINLLRIIREVEEKTGESLE